MWPSPTRLCWGNSVRWVPSPRPRLLCGVGFVPGRGVAPDGPGQLLAGTLGGEILNSETWFSDLGQSAFCYLRTLLKWGGTSCSVGRGTDVASQLSRWGPAGAGRLLLRPLPRAEDGPSFGIRRAGDGDSLGFRYLSWWP